MNLINKITKQDFKLLKEKYSDEEFPQILKKIEEGYPVQYLIGWVDFYGRKFIVNPSVLIPRFETELLVEKTIKYIKSNFKSASIIDIGTGSGAIAQTIYCELKNQVESRIQAIDISAKALGIARKNCDNSIELKKIDVLKDKINEKFDVVISNPPYISINEQVDIQTIHEPQNALYADNNGLIFYETILSKKLIKTKGLIAFEIGSTQGPYIKKLAEKYYPNAQILIEQDYTSRDRFVFIIQNLNK